MKKTAYILLFAAASASAQNLSTEITVDRTVVPAERAAARPASVHPSIASAAIEPVRLDMAEYTGSGTVTRSASVLAPAAWADTFALSPYRGYASLGYFPVYNLAFSAGYDILRTHDTRLGLWGQFDGTSYKDPNCNGFPEKIGYNIGTVGANFDHRFGHKGVLTTSASYGFGGITSPVGDPYRSLGMADVDVAWYGRAGRIGYHADAFLHTFSFSPRKLIDGTGARPDGTELRYGLSAGVIGRIGNGLNHSRLGLEIKADMLARPAVPAGDYINQIYPASTIGLITATPYYAFGGSTGAAMRLGARVDISTGGEGKTLHIAPDVMLSYNARAFSIYARAGGGEVLNTNRSLFEITPFAPTGMRTGRSHVPVTVDAGVNIGPFAGASFEVFAGWAKANDWLMPFGYYYSESGAAPYSPSGCEFVAVDLSGVRAGIRAAYDWRDVVSVSASAEFAPGSGKGAWYLWRDRAKTVVKADAAVRPIDRLELKASYELRSGRRSQSSLSTNEGSKWLTLDMKSVSNLSFGARYSISDAIDVFARGENLLGKRTEIIPGVPSQGVHGLVGAAFKF
ncbi:MAG: hypothetical protein K2L21_03810 [Muribaculaceae bacterium]|nr:hypothetical protein [Muribaculaceae bacterium]